jgi:hypothetical protein
MTGNAPTHWMGSLCLPGRQKQAQLRTAGAQNARIRLKPARVILIKDVRIFSLKPHFFNYWVYWQNYRE